MKYLSVGFSRVDITPDAGIELYGYYQTRVSEGTLDPLEINAVAISDNKTKAVIISIDNCGIVRYIAEDFKAEIERATGIPAEAVYIHATHTHTAPYLVNRDKKADDVLINIINTNPSEEQKQLQQEYFLFVRKKIVEAAKTAVSDLTPAKAFYGRSEANGIGFIRRYRMKDGSVRTNPGKGNPNILEPIGRPDDEISIISFEREAKDGVLIVSYGNHPDVISGYMKYSSQWCGHTRRILENAVPKTKCVFLTGTMGDVNHINTDPTVKSIEPYAHSYRMGQVVAGGVLRVLGWLRPIEDAVLCAKQRVVSVVSNMPTGSDDMNMAHRVNGLHNAGRDIELTAEDMNVPRAARLVRLERGPISFEMTVSAVCIGGVAFIGIPGQLFAASGFELKNIKGWDMIIPTAQTNGSEGYFPTASAYSEGSYETDASNFKAGVAEQLVKESEILLNEIKGEEL